MCDLKALFVIDTPSQVFNLQEALKEYQISVYDIIICDCCRADAFIQLQQLLSRLDPEHLIEVPRITGPVEDRIHIYAQHLPWLKRQQYSQVFFSNIRQQWQRDIVCSLPDSQAVLMDDGNATLVFYRYLFSQQQFFDFPLDTNTQRAQSASQARLDHQISITPPMSLELFTVFDLPELPWLSIRRNHLLAMKHQFLDVNNNEVILLGGGETELNYLSEIQYIQLLKQVSAMFLGRKISYVPHRITKSEFVEQIRQQVPLQILQPNQPIEDWFRQQIVPPATVVGFYSMALTTIALSFNSIRVISIDPGIEVWRDAELSHVWNLTKCNNLQVIESIMDYMRNWDAIEILTLDNK